MSESSARRRTGRSKGDEREALILDAVRTLLAQKSMAAVTIDDITQAAGISRTSFYFYFPSKHAVLTRLMEEIGDSFVQTHDWLGTDGQSRESLRAQLVGAEAIWRSNRPIMACSLQGYGETYEPLVEFVDRIQQRFITGLAAKIERDRAAGLAPSGIGATTLAGLVESVREARLAQLAERPEAEVAEGLDELVEAILRLVYGRI